MEYWGVIVLLCSCWLLQVFLSINQQKHYFKKMNELKKSTDGHLGVGISKSKFNLGPGVILILTTSTEGKVSNYYVMNGISTFSRFKNREKNINQVPSELLIKNKKEQNAFNQALNLINEERVKQKLTTITL